MGGDFGVFGAPTPPPGGRAGSENDTLLPLTKTHDRPNVMVSAKIVPCRSKVIVGKPWRRNNKKQERKKSDKTIRHSRWGMPK